MKIVFSARATASLREIALHIAEDDRSRALAFVRRLRAQAKKISQMPQAFPLVARYQHHGIRRRAVENYLIFYRTERDRLTIVDVIHGARDYEALLFGDD